MKNITRLSSSISLEMPSLRPRLQLPLLFVTVAMLLLLLSTASSTFAGSATWKMNPATGDWNHAANWTPPTIPNGPSDTATFASSNTRRVSISGRYGGQRHRVQPGRERFHHDRQLDVSLEN